MFQKESVALFPNLSNTRSPPLCIVDTVTLFPLCLPTRRSAHLKDVVTSCFGIVQYMSSVSFSMTRTSECDVLRRVHARAKSRVPTMRGKPYVCAAWYKFFTRTCRQRLMILAYVLGGTAQKAITSRHFRRGEAPVSTDFHFNMVNREGGKSLGDQDKRQSGSSNSLSKRAVAGSCSRYAG